MPVPCFSEYSLLMMSDEIFLQFFNRLFRFLNPFRFMREIDFENIIGVIVTFILGMTALYAFFAGLFRLNLGGADVKKTGTSNYITGYSFREFRYCFCFSDWIPACRMESLIHSMHIRVSGSFYLSVLSTS